jgi:hypothetical protein
MTIKIPLNTLWGPQCCHLRLLPQGAGNETTAERYGVLNRDTVLHVEDTDRIRLNCYGPPWQTVKGVLSLLKKHRGHNLATLANVGRIKANNCCVVSTPDYGNCPRGQPLVRPVRLEEV